VNSLLVALQLLLLLPMAALLVLAFRTSRADRRRHNGFMGMAFLIALAASVAALTSLALAIGGEEEVEPVLTFLPPALTLLAGALVARRALSRPAPRARPG
jgi:cation transport ATPase